MWQFSSNPECLWRALKCEIYTQSMQGILKPISILLADEYAYKRHQTMFKDKMFKMNPCIAMDTYKESNNDKKMTYH